MFKLFKYLRPHWVATLLAPLLMLIEVSMDLLQPYLMASIVDQGIMVGDQQHIIQTGLKMLGAAVIGLIGGVGCSIYSSIASQRFGEDLRQDLFRNIQTFSFKNIDELKTGSLITRLTNDIVQLQQLVQMLLRVFVRSPMLAVGSIIMAIYISPKLAIILAIAVPLLFIIMFLLISTTLPLFKKVQLRLDRLNTVLQENLSGIRLSKAFVRRKYETDRFQKANDDYTETSVKAQKLIAINMPILTLILNISIVFVLMLGGKDAINGQFEVGQLIAFINYVTQVLFSVSSVAMLLVKISSAKVSADRVNEVLHTKTYIHNPSQPKKPNLLREGSVSFHNVSFRYEDTRKPVLQAIDLEIPARQKTAIIGSTGSGKTSLVHLIPRMYDVTEGEVRVNGLNVKQYDLTELRKIIGIVLQESILFSGTIRDNICYGKPDATDEEMMNAAKIAQAHEFISQLPDGYHTVLGQRGINLSGGQKQRLSIARALLIKPSILILDDSTSAIDMATESKMKSALHDVMSNATTILIAQRISSVQDADQIIVLDQGQVIARGNHHQLMETCEVYKDIYRSQLGKEEAVYESR